MGLGSALARGAGVKIEAYAPTDDFWYQPVAGAGGGVAMSGVRVNAPTALSTSPVWACVCAIADPVATVPIMTYRRRTDGGKERATDHPLYDVLHDQPNDLQTAFTFKRVMMVWALLWGNAYAQIVPGARGAVDQLVPLHPDGVRVTRPDGSQIGQGTDPNIVYRVRQRDGTEATLFPDEVLHIRGLTIDGTNGLSLMQCARESIGLAIATQTFSAKFFGQGARPSGFLKVKGKLSEDGKKRLAAQMQSVHGGVTNMHKIAVLEEDTDWAATGMSNEDAQLISLIEWNVADLARWFRVPLHMIGETSKVTSWGTGIEQLGIGFVTYSLLPWLENWQQEIRKSLILAKGAYFAEFLVDALVRGDIKTRYEAYRTGREGGWLTVNQILALENMNPIGPEGDTRLQPLNYAPLGTVPAPSAPPSGGQASREAEAMALHLFIGDAVDRVIRKEQAAMTRAAKRAETEADGWRAGVTGFYGDHAAYVSMALRLPSDTATQYASRQYADLLASGPTVDTDWWERSAETLKRLALESATERSLPACDTATS